MKFKNLKMILIFLIFLAITVLSFINFPQDVHCSEKSKTQFGSQASSIATESYLSNNEIFWQVFDNFNDIKFYMNFNFFSLLKNIKYENHKIGDMLYKLMQDGKKYEYEYSIFPAMAPLNSTLNHIMWAIYNVDSFEHLDDKDKQILRTSLFFHDLDKAFNPKNHPEISVKIAKQFLQPSKTLTQENIDLICIIILHHHELGEFPRTKNVLEQLGQQELKFLYYMTLCDIIGRKNLDTIANKKRILDAYNILRTKNKHEIKELVFKLETINLLLKSTLSMLYAQDYNVFYKLKALFYEYDITLYKKISASI